MSKKPTYEELEQRVKELGKESFKRKQAEEALQLERDNFINILNSMEDGVYIVNQQYDIEYANPVLQEEFGPFVGRKCFEYFHNLKEACEWCKNPEVFVGKTVRWEWYSSKSQKTYDLIDTPLKNLDGSISKLEIFRDVTDRKRAEEALRESEKKLKFILDSLPDMVLEVDAGLKVLWANKVALDLNPQAIGQTCHEAFPGNENVCEGCNCIRAFESGKIEMGIMYQPSSKTAGESYWENIGVPLKDSSGNVTTILEVSRNVTQRELAKKMERQLQSQLRQAQKMEALGTLVGGIAHEFNNVLGIIIGNTELSLDDVPEWNPVHYNLKEIKTASLRAKDVVRQLLSYIRKIDYMKKPMKAIPVVKDSIKFLRSTIPTGIDIRQNIQATVDTILADPTQIHQIMLNLGTNAAHAMEEAGGVLEIEIKNVNLGEESVDIDPDLIPGNYVKITVSDTGHGIEPEIVDRIFDPFFTTKEVGKGSGMGLSVVHGIVKSYKGAISIESELGKGTTLSIFFPVTEEEAVIEPKTFEEIPTGNERILFIDDEELMVNMAKQILERLGYQVETKMNPVEALELFRSNPDQFDLVITDMAMPQMDGDKLANEILNIRTEMPIILCTGFSEKVSEENAKELGIKAFAMKPLVKRDLAVVVRKVLDEK